MKYNNKYVLNYINYTGGLVITLLDTSRKDIDGYTAIYDANMEINYVLDRLDTDINYSSLNEFKDAVETKIKRKINWNKLQNIAEQYNSHAIIKQ